MDESFSEIGPNRQPSPQLSTVESGSAERAVRIDGQGGILLYLTCRSIVRHAQGRIVVGKRRVIAVERGAGSMKCAQRCTDKDGTGELVGKRTRATQHHSW
jgi:hypothetical protein